MTGTRGERGVRGRRETRGGREEEWREREEDVQVFEIETAETSDDAKTWRWRSSCASSPVPSPHQSQAITIISI
jgi:hypothetical protein